MESHRVTGTEPFVADLEVRGCRVGAKHSLRKIPPQAWSPGGYALGSFLFDRLY